MSTMSQSKESVAESTNAHQQLYVKVGNYRGRLVAVKYVKKTGVNLNMSTLRELRLVSWVLYMPPLILYYIIISTIKIRAT